MKVLIMNGAAESGKGEVAKLIEKCFSLQVKSYSSIDYVKQVAEESFGWDGHKDIIGRNLLASIKQIMIRYNDFPTLKVIEVIERDEIDLLIVDIREPDEIEKLVNYCMIAGIPCATCRVINDGAEKAAESSELNMTGDRMYGLYSYDISITNNGTLEELEALIEPAFERFLQCVTESESFLNKERRY